MMALKEETEINNYTKMLKTITFGDPHGRNFWEDINPDNYDKIIFVGDYVDSYDLSNLEIKVNLNNIISFKKEYSDKVILLLGNHDLPYYYYFMGNVDAGFRIEAWVDLHTIFRDNKELFQCAFQIENYIWTHAGVIEGWYNRYVPDMIKKHDIQGNLAEVLNILFESNYKALYTCTSIRGGYSPEGSPYWAHWTEMVETPLKGYHHIFGHTYNKNVETVYIDENTSVTVVDPGDGGAGKFYELKIENDEK